MTEAEWDACADPTPMLEFLHGKASDRKQRLFAIAWCRNEWHLLSDERSRRAVEIAEMYVEGQATAEALEAAYEAAYAAAYEHDLAGIGQRSSSALYSAGNVAARTVGAPAFPAFEPVGIASQMAIVRDIFGNPFRPSVLDPSWLTWHDGAVRKMAQTIYDERRFADLPILADALEDAGCADAAILAHCRGRGEHVRGCWVVDLLTGHE